MCMAVEETNWSCGHGNLYVNTEFDWEVKWGFVKVSVNRAVHVISGELIVLCTY